MKVHFLPADQMKLKTERKNFVCLNNLTV